MKLYNSESLIIPALSTKLALIKKEFYEQTGHLICITETWRSKERQAKLYAQGRTEKGPIVTNAEFSNHQIGLAVDVCGDVDPLKTGRQNPWDINWPKLGAIVISHDLIWGGQWGDSCHIEIRGKYTNGQIKEMIEAEGLLFVWQKIHSYYAHR